MSGPNDQELYLAAGQHRTSHDDGDAYLLLAQARESLRRDLAWRGPQGRPQGIITLPRDQAAAVLNVLDALDKVFADVPR